MSIHSFVKAVASLQFENAFNPYSDRCEVHDRQGAPQWRAHTLSAVIDKAAKMAVDAVWIGRDLGYRGGRRTGLALTDDIPVAQQPSSEERSGGIECDSRWISRMSPFHLKKYNSEQLSIFKHT